MLRTAQSRWLVPTTDRLTGAEPGSWQGTATAQPPRTASGPSSQCAEDGADAPTFLRRERIDRARRGRGQLTLLDQPCVLEVAQPVGEEIAGDAGQPGTEVGEPLLPEGQLTQDQQGPAVTDDVERAGGGTVLVVASAR